MREIQSWGRYFKRNRIMKKSREIQVRYGDMVRVKVGKTSTAGTIKAVFENDVLIDTKLLGSLRLPKTDLIGLD